MEVDQTNIVDSDKIEQNGAFSDTLIPEQIMSTEKLAVSESDNVNITASTEDKSSANKSLNMVASQQINSSVNEESKDVEAKADTVDQDSTVAVPRNDIVLETGDQVLSSEIGEALTPNVPNDKPLTSNTDKAVGPELALPEESLSPGISDPDQTTSSTVELSTESTGLEQKLGKKGKTKRRGSAWTDDETDFLMEVWARHSKSGSNDYDFPQNTPVYRLISKAMIEKGFDKSWEQCKTRIHTLKRAYKTTQDEVNTGKTNIIYCKHFDKLKILMGDDPITSPKMLSENLSVKRKERELMSKNAQVKPVAPTTPTPKRKLGTGKRSVKRQNSGNDKSPVPSTSLNSLHITSTPETIFNSDIISNPWFNTQPVSAITTAATTQQTVFLPPVQCQMLPAPPPYQPPKPQQTSQSFHVTPQVHRPQLQEINNNTILVKSEPAEEPMKVSYTPSPSFTNFSVLSNPICTNNSQSKTNQLQKREELEKLKLDLEMRKLDMERNKLEMEERQRREERDHQYRMMQLLLFGLGQQNTANVTGHATEQDLGNVSNTATLSRAIENGLLPGGTLRANEKGLSFSEI